jgi:hypothetical protein
MNLKNFITLRVLTLFNLVGVWTHQTLVRIYIVYILS